MGDKFKLSTGREVELHDLTFDQREECENIRITVILDDGVMGMANTAKSRNLWCQHGLKEEREKLNQYSSEELTEIAFEVQRKSCLDPTGLES